MARAPEGERIATGPKGPRNDKKRDNITVVSFMILEDGSTVPFEDLTEEQKQRWREACCRRLSTRLSAYYSQHPEEYAKL